MAAVAKCTFQSGWCRQNTPTASESEAAGFNLVRATERVANSRRSQTVICPGN